MVDPRRTATNAADSAPGVDDGRTRAAGPPVDSKPGGRKVVFWIVAISLVLLAIVFVARPAGNRGADGGGAISATREELQVSQEPSDPRDTAQSAATPQ